MNIGMYRPYKVMIGKDVNPTGTGLNNLADGQLAVVKADGTFLTAGETLADSEYVYIAQGTATAGQPVLSPRIKGLGVTKWAGQARAAAAQQVSYIGFNTATANFEVQDADLSTNTTYKITINFPFDKEVRSLRTWAKQFEYTVGGTTVGAALAMTDNLAAQINADTECAKYVVAVGGTTIASGTGFGIRITGLAQTHGQHDVHDFVTFEVFLGDTWYSTTTEIAVDQFGYIEAAAGKTTTNSASINPYRGVGTYDQVLDIERFAQGFWGFTNRTLFPVIIPTVYADSAEAYDLYLIEWTDDVFDNSLNINRHLNQLIVAIPFKASCANNNGILFENVLNPFMASCPGAFANVTI